jgi:hypothetical protein
MLYYLVTYTVDGVIANACMSTNKSLSRNVLDQWVLQLEAREKGEVVIMFLYPLDYEPLDKEEDDTQSTA